MGSSCSRATHISPPGPSPSLGDLPENCVAAILSHLDDPADICAFASLNRVFRSASLVDFLWAPKLPPNYEVLVKELLGRTPGNLGKRDIFAGLCRPKTFDDGSKRVWLDKSTSRICLEISWRGLTIRSGIFNVQRHQKFISTSESRFGSVTYLSKMPLFEVFTRIKFPFPPGAYTVFIRLRSDRPKKRFSLIRLCNSSPTNGPTGGLAMKPLQFQLRGPDHSHTSVELDLVEPGKWVNYHVGDFTVGKTGKRSKVKFHMSYNDLRGTNGGVSVGVSVDSLLVCPVEFKKRLRHSSRLSQTYGSW